MEPSSSGASAGMFPESIAHRRQSDGDIERKVSDRLTHDSRRDAFGEGRQLCAESSSSFGFSMPNQGSWHPSVSLPFDSDTTLDSIGGAGWARQSRSASLHGHQSEALRRMNSFARDGPDLRAYRLDGMESFSSVPSWPESSSGSAGYDQLNPGSMQAASTRQIDHYRDQLSRPSSAGLVQPRQKINMNTHDCGQQNVAACGRAQSTGNNTGTMRGGPAVSPPGIEMNGTSPAVTEELSRCKDLLGELEKDFLEQCWQHGHQLTSLRSDLDALESGVSKASSTWPAASLGLDKL